MPSGRRLAFLRRASVRAWPRRDSRGLSRTQRRAVRLGPSLRRECMAAAKTHPRQVDTARFIIGVDPHKRSHRPRSSISNSRLSASCASPRHGPVLASCSTGLTSGPSVSGPLKTPPVSGGASPKRCLELGNACWMYRQRSVDVYGSSKERVAVRPTSPMQSTVRGLPVGQASD